ncbi:MAG: YjbH domain-containing protein [Pseudomonadota bacterium]
MPRLILMPKAWSKRVSNVGKVGTNVRRSSNARGFSFRTAILGSAVFASSGVALSDESGVPFEFSSDTTLNFYGSPGLIDTPSAYALPDGQLAVSVSNFGGQTRTSLTFQAFPRVSASFRYIGIQDWNSDGFDTYRDRNFDVALLLSKERKHWPALSVGLRDFAGTGIYASEYVVASKSFEQPLGLPGRFNVTAGLGWGRLGSSGDIGSSGDRPAFDPDDEGGEPSTDQWFRGPYAPFGGIEWQVNDRLGVKLEYSPDAYEPETSRGVFEIESRVNFGVEYQAAENLRLGAYYLYGSELGVSAQLQFNPRRAVTPVSVAGPRPIIKRPSRRAAPDAWDTAWSSSESAPVVIRDALREELSEDGLRLEAIAVTATSAELRVTNLRYGSNSLAVGRAARAMARVMPASVDTFRVTLEAEGLPLSTVSIRRQDLESLEFVPDGSTALLARTDIDDAAPDLQPGGSADALDTYPRFNWSLGPFISPSYFDTEQPVRADVGLSAQFRYRLRPGLLVAGDLRQRFAGNVEDTTETESELPRVRTDARLFAEEGQTAIENLYVANYWKPSRDIYARVTAGYLESMFGGVSGELLWKPATSRLAFGAEANFVRQRDFDQMFGFQDYDVATGHISAYYEIGGGYIGQVDVGRYLAGDTGATFTISREFKNGWKVGGFFTLTDVSAEEFGEGSFDKGINLTIPLNWFLGKPTQQTVSTTIRPIQRDGGARLGVPGRLYEVVRPGHQAELVSDWSRVWE